MSPIDWVKRPLQKYADFSGRASRPEYWWFVLAYIVAFMVIQIIESLLGIGTMVAGLYGPLMTILALGLLVPSLAVAVRRLHDTNRSGWWLLLVFIPYAIAGFLMARAMTAVDPATGLPEAAGLGSAGIFGVIALICAIVVLVFLVLPGTDGENRYGQRPGEDPVVA